MDSNEDVIEIVPMDEYDSQKAKLQASLFWILSKAYGDQIPAEFKEPFYETSEGFVHVKPRLANLMVTSELYCQACRNMFGETHSQWQGHWSIIQVLSRKGIYIVEPDDTEVTETILMKNAPFQQDLKKLHCTFCSDDLSDQPIKIQPSDSDNIVFMINPEESVEVLRTERRKEFLRILHANAHLALIDSLMIAFVSETVSVERVVQAVRKFAVFNASSELPSDSESAVVFWINKVCGTVQSKEQKGSQVLEGESKMKVRIVSRSGESTVEIPYIEDFLQDIGDGCCLAVLVHFYCPDLLKLQDICLKSNIGIADSLYNLSKVKNFCSKHLPYNCFHLSYEDFLYTHNNLKQNLYALIADLFSWFEVHRAPSVTSPTKEDAASRPTTAKHLTSNRLPNLPISNVTKQSFKRGSMDDSGLHSPQGGAVHMPPHKPLLPRRQMRSEERETHPPVTQSKRGGRRSLSLSSAKERDVIQETMLAWEDNKNKSQDKVHTQSSASSNLLQDKVHTSSASSNLLANVSIDSDMMDSFSDDVLGSIDVGDDGEPTPRPTLQKVAPPQREQTQSVTSNIRNPDHPDYMEVQSVTSAVSRMTDHSGKEGSHFQDGGHSVKSSSNSIEPLLPARLKPAKEKTNNHSKDQERSHVVDRKSPTKKDIDTISRDSKSPTRSKGKSSESVGSFSLSEDSSVTDSVTPLPDEMFSDTEISQRGKIDKPAYTAFSISGNFSSDRNVDKSSDSVKLSYTIQDHVYTPETARAAGIPVVSESGEKTSFVLSDLKRSESHEGSVCSRSSSEFSDHESRKIHKDHKIKESDDIKTPTNETEKKIYIVSKDPDTSEENNKRTLTTNFAEIRRLKQGVGKVDNSGLVYMQHGQESSNGEGKKSALRDPNSNGTKSEKKTTFAPTSNRTTWQQTAQGTSSSGEATKSEEPPVPSELLQIKMKLEEKRKMIEKKKQRNEIQQQRLRQKLGKTAFLHVLKKPGDVANGVPEESQEDTRSSSSGSVEDISGARLQDAHINRPAPAVRKEHSPSPSRNVTEEADQACANGNSQRAFSREGIQQTIENVRKKWFRDDAEVVTQTYAEKPETPDSPPPVEQFNEKRKSTETYNTSLDKFDRNLTDLQMEINRLSLQQEQIKQSRGIPPVPQRLPEQQNVHRGHVQQHPQPVQSPVTMTSAHNMSRGAEISYPPQQMHHQQHPVGPVVPSQNQYMPITCTGHNQFIPPYNGYQQGFSPSYPYPPPPHHIHGQSPPYPVTPQVGMAPLTSSPYSHSTLPAFSPMGHGIPTSTVQPGVLPPSSHVGAQMYQPVPQTVTNFQQVSPAIDNLHSTDRSVPATVSQSQLTGHYQNVMPGNEQNASHTIHETQNLVPSSGGPTTNAQLHSESVISTSSQNKNQTENRTNTDDQTTSGNNEFFVSFNDSTPKPKPELGKNRKKSEQTIPNKSELENSNQSNVCEGESLRNQENSRPSDSSLQNTSECEGQNISGIGFVIGQDETSIDQDEAEEIQKKKEKLIQLQQKRKEENEKKRQYKEIEMSRRKEQERLKQEQADQRKLDEKLRREQIFRQYQEKKLADEDDSRPVVKRERSLRQKTRPQSMFVKPNKPSQAQALHTSQEDLSGTKAGRRIPPRSNTFHHGKMRKAVSCNTLTTSGEGKSLSFGGMTHRTRPPSPDLHGRGKMSASGSSETGSMSGSDYSGPKLYVKPSTKSNKSIIHNAISHCCLAGSVNTTMKNKVIEVLEGSEGHHFMILFRDHSCQYRGLFMYYADTDFIIKLHGVGPNRITNSMIEKFYKYNSGGKKFTEVSSTKHLSVSIDAVVIHNSLWKTHKMAAKNK